MARSDMDITTLALWLLSVMELTLTRKIEKSARVQARLAERHAYA